MELTYRCQLYFFLTIRTHISLCSSLLTHARMPASSRTNLILTGTSHRTNPTRAYRSTTRTPARHRCSCTGGRTPTPRRASPRLRFMWRARLLEPKLTPCRNRHRDENGQGEKKLCTAGTASDQTSSVLCSSSASSPPRASTLMC